MTSKHIFSRFAVFALASSSFACLIGAFYGWWPMRAFACWVFPPCIAALVWLAWRGGNERIWIVEGALGGLVAAVIYDIFRVPFVLMGYPLFGVFPLFGQMLLNAAPNDFSANVQIAGWIYHFSNGISLGIMFLAMAYRPNRKSLFWGAVAWALCVEIMLLLTPYYSFFQLKMDKGAFLWLTLSAHSIFGIALGLWCRARVANKSPLSIGAT